MPFGAILCSDLQRARETAELAGLVPRLPSPLLREMALGRWTGRLLDDVKAIEPDAYAAWKNGLAGPPDGESWAIFDVRVRAALASIAAMGEERVAVVTHNGFIRAAVRILGMTEHDPARSFDSISITTATLPSDYSGPEPTDNEKLGQDEDR
jgi:broad specificity phosphatase PhoE